VDIKETEQGDLVALALIGSVDTRSSFDFEKKVLERLAGNSRFFVIDFTEVDQLTSSGIRVLLMLAQKLGSVDGELALCGLSAHVQTVMEITGLSDHFSILPTRDAAIERLRSAGKDTGAAKVSKISSLAIRLLGGRAAKTPRKSSGADSGSRLSQQVAKILSGGRTHDKQARGGEDNDES